MNIAVVHEKVNSPPENIHKL